jgi:endonuclease YncB( thermonuclease family)
MRFSKFPPALRAASLALAAFLSFAANSADYGTATVSRVVRVRDGDTFAVDIDGWPPVMGRGVPVRLLGIDAPELRGRCPAETEMAQKARRHAQARLAGVQAVELRRIGRDKYFRLLAEAWIDGKSLGDELLALGLARAYGGGAKKSWCAR